MNNNIQNNAMLAQFGVSMLGANKNDGAESSTYAKSKNSQIGSVKVVKALFDKKDLSDMRTHVTEARKVHNRMTLPWNDGGQRLLPSSMFSDYQAEMMECKSNFDYTVELFVKDYEAIKRRAKLRLGDIYDESDYPDITQVSDRFKMRTSIVPMPKSEDFRSHGLNDADVAVLKKEMEMEIAEKSKTAIKDILFRIKDAFSHLSEKLDQDKSRIHQRTVDRVFDVLEEAQKLNVYDNESINKICQDILNRSGNGQFIALANSNYSAKHISNNLAHKVQMTNFCDIAKNDIELACNEIENNLGIWGASDE
jgi:hypothetical protein